MELVIPKNSYLRKSHTIHHLITERSETLHKTFFRRNLNLVGIDLNITSNGASLGGYNLFLLGQQNYIESQKVYNYTLLIIDDKGELMFKRELGNNTRVNKLFTMPLEFINSTTLLLGGLDGAVLWNIYNNKTINLGFRGHHEYEYNPLNNSIFTFQSYLTEINGTEYLFDTIVEFNTTGNLIWSLDTQSFISLAQWCPFQDFTHNGEADVTHSNSIFYDPDEDVLYVNVRNVNTFYKIDHKTGEIIWGLGEYGNFLLNDIYCKQRKVLFYHAHAIKKIDDHTFILFDNDLHNQTDPSSQHSRILEITINETSMTANESWSWIAPHNYYSPYWGDANRLPNGNRIGVFGTDEHPSSNIGAILVEVNDTGQIVWEMNFPNTTISFMIFTKLNLNHA